MRLLVTGCGRSGTTWFAAAVGSTGVECSHEKVYAPGRKARDSWVAEASAFAAPFTPQDGTYVVHLVRHPLRVVASMANRRGKPESRQYVREHLGLAPGGDRLTYLGNYWVGWNGLVTADERLRLEDVTAETITRLARLVDPDAKAATLPTRRLNRARTNPRPLQWLEVAHVPGMLDRAAEYGYRS